MSEAGKKHVILGQIPEERRQDAALFLSGCFSLPLNATKSIAASGPIALLTDLTQRQGEAILAELTASLPAGVELTLGDESVSMSFSRLQWPRPPRIFGRDLVEFLEHPQTEALACPVCGCVLHATIQGDGGILLAASSGVNGKPAGGVNLIPADQDPLFSGVKPLATANTDLMSLRSLQAGDTGFWMSSETTNTPPLAVDAVHPVQTAGIVKKGQAKAVGGQAAFMKPGIFAVIVGRTRDSQTVKMIAEIMGIDESDARIRGLNAGFCVARDIALDEAQNLLSRFRNTSARARIVKLM